MASLASRRKQLREEIDGDEQQLRESLSKLKDSLQAKVDVRQQVTRRPYEALALAIGVGFLFGVWPSPSQVDDGTSMFDTFRNDS